MTLLVDRRASRRCTACYRHRWPPTSNGCLPTRPCENMELIAACAGGRHLAAAAGDTAAAIVAMAAALLHLIAHAAFKASVSLPPGRCWPRPACVTWTARWLGSSNALYHIFSVSPRSARPVAARRWVRQRVAVRASADPCPIRPQHRGRVGHPARGRRGRADDRTRRGAMVKAFGIGFLARPRSDAGADAREAPASMITGMVVGRLRLRRAGRRAVRRRPPLAPRARTLPAVSWQPTWPRWSMVLHLPGLDGSIAPGLIAAAARRGRADRGGHRPGGVASTPGTGGVAAVGVRRRRPHLTHAVHGDLVRPTAAAGLRRRAARPTPTSR